MRFLPTDEHLAFSEAIDGIVEAHGGPEIARAWGKGELHKGAKLWTQFVETGLMSLCLTAEEGGLGGTAADLITIFERLGYHGVPGPLVESIVLLPSLVTPQLRQGIAKGEVIATAAVNPVTPYALDADFANTHFLIDSMSIAKAQPKQRLYSIDPARRLFRLITAGQNESLDPKTLSHAVNATALATAATLLGIGERLLEESVNYAKTREQFGRKIGEYQALKHQLANVRVALSFARPLVQGAAITLNTSTGSRDTSAAKVQASKAANLAATVGLQVHAGIGYTEEHNLSIWLRRVPALTHVWGTIDFHRSRVGTAITSE